MESLAPGGRYAAELEGLSTATLLSEPAGAGVWLFRYVQEAWIVEGGEPRLVAVPAWGPLPAVDPGTWCLRPARPGGELAFTDRITAVAGHPVEGSVLVDACRPGGPLQRGHRLLEVDGEPVRTLHQGRFYERPAEGRRIRRFVFERGGESLALEAASLAELGVSVTDARGLAESGGVTASVYRMGAAVELELGPGGSYRATASPLLFTPACRAGATPLEGLELPEGAYLAVLQLAGHEDARLPFDVVAGEPAEAGAQLVPAGTSPLGFVAVTHWTGSAAGVETPFWIQEREVTCAEYLEFLNQPESLRRIAESTEPVLYPRASVSTRAESFFTQGANGAFLTPDGMRPDWAVPGLSAADATAYAAWLTERSRAAGDGWTFLLPTLEEIDAVRLVSRHRAHVAGERFRPRWVKSSASAPLQWIEPVMQYPVDELPHGVFDVSGSSSEWTRISLGGDRAGERAVYGGSWLYGVPAHFELDFTFADDAESCAGERSFRLVARR